MRLLQPPGWPAPKGYSNGIAAHGELVVVGGQIGWDETGAFAQGLAAQVGQALRNIATVLETGGLAVTDIVRLTWFVVDVEDYRQNLKPIGAGYRAVMGRHFPVMSVIGCTRLVEPEALVEIEATAVRAQPHDAPA